MISEKSKSAALAIIGVLSLSVSMSIAGERGKSIAFNKADNSKSNLEFKDLNRYNIGGEVTYNQVSFAGSYMNYNKSLTNSTVDTRGKNIKTAMNSN